MTGLRALITLGAIGSATAHAKPISIHLKGGSIHDLGRELSTQTGCHVMAMVSQTLDFDADKLTLWDVLTKLEVENSIFASLQMGTIILDTKPPVSAAPRPQLSWASDWQRHDGWAVAYVPGRVGGFTFQTGSSAPPQDDHHGRLWIVNVDDYVIDHVTIDHATAGKTKLAVKTGTISNPGRACAEGVVELTFDSPQTSGYASIAGQVVARIPKTLEHKVAVPTGDEVVDIASGRLRIHVGARPGRSPGYRDVHVGWDGMGDRVLVNVEIVDEHGAPVVTMGHGSSSGGSQGSDDRTIAWTAGAKAFVTLRVPSGAFTEQRIPFRFDKVSLAPPAPPPAP